MRRIAILLALTVIGGAVPAASFGPRHLVAAVLVFAAALVALLATCVASGWLLCERRTLNRMAARPVGVAYRTVGHVPAVSASRQRWAAARPLQANGSRATLSYSAATKNSSVARAGWSGEADRARRSGPVLVAG
jgi:hypothetical protein